MNPEGKSGGGLKSFESGARGRTRGVDAQCKPLGPGQALSADLIKALTDEELSASGIVTRKTRYDSAGRLVGQRVLQADASHSHDLHDQGTAQSRGMRSDNPDKPGQVRRPRSTPA